MVNIDFFKTWIVPPVVGAIIGYFTNWLAIKMLFRPLREIRIGRFKMPFTPGILPRERYKLAESVGDTVASELLTTEVFASRLQEPEMRGKIEAAIYEWLKEIASTDSGELLASVINTETVDHGSTMKNKGEIAELVRASATGLLHSPEFGKAIEQTLRNISSGISEKKLGELLSPRKAAEIAERVVEKAKSLSDEEVFDRFVDSATRAISVKAPALIPENVLIPAIDLVSRTLYRSILPVIASLLESPGISERMKEEGLGIVHRTIQSLGPIQRLIVTAANYESSLEKSMPDTIEDLRKTIMEVLKDPSMSDRISTTLQAGFRASRNKSEEYTDTGFDSTGDSWAISTDVQPRMAGIFPTADLKNVVKICVGELDSTRKDFARNVEVRFEALADRKIGELFPDVDGIASSFIEILLTTGDSAESGEKSKAKEQNGIIERIPDIFMASFLEGVRGKTLGELLSFDENKLRALADLVAETLLATLSSQAERLVAALDIRTMVVEKINTLDMKEAEQLIFKVVNKELEWITLLGGILGAIIGIFQSLISIL
jgi:uncharacterized membrane protein YheB (UPF0754 family)